MWEACVTAFAWRCYAFIDRISEYGREVGEFRIAPVMRELTMPWGGTMWDIEPMSVQVPNGCIDADAPPKVPPKVMLGGDAQRFLSLRLTETGNAWLVEQRASFSDLADTGAFGSGVQDLETINARLLDNVLRVAAAIHCINEANELLALDWFKEEDRGAGPLEIPDIVLKDAWDFVQHALLASLENTGNRHPADQISDLRQTRRGLTFRRRSRPSALGSLAGLSPFRPHVWVGLRDQSKVRVGSQGPGSLDRNRALWGTLSHHNPDNDAEGEHGRRNDPRMIPYHGVLLLAVG
jgi:hypothetical protein